MSAGNWFGEALLAIARVAVGGGTPTFLDAVQLAELFDVTEHTLGADLHAVPVAVETSPATAEPDKLGREGSVVPLLKSAGVEPLRHW